MIRITRLSKFVKSHTTRLGKRQILVLLGTIACVLIMTVQGISQNLLIPSPEEVDKLSKQYQPEEIIRIADQVDEKLRDQLRFDPQWKPILEAVRKDLREVKLGYKPVKALEKPAWRRYGQRIYPLLDYYTRVGDEARQDYGLTGIRSLGKPYTTAWLTKQLKRQSSNPVFNLISAAPWRITEDGKLVTEDRQWQKDFGLDDPAVRAELIVIARANLKPKTAPDYETQFNLKFLWAVEGMKVTFRPIFPTEAELNTALQKWLAFTKSPQPSNSEIKAAIDYFQELPLDSKEHLLVEGFANVEVGQLSPVAQELLQELGTDNTFPKQNWALAELNRQDDSQELTALKSLAKKEKSFPALSEWVRFERLQKPSQNQVKDAISYYKRLPIDAQKYILVKRLGKMKAGQIVPVGKELLRSIASEQQSPDRFWAIAELDRHGDPQGSELIQEIINENLTKMYNLTRVVTYQTQEDYFYEQYKDTSARRRVQYFINYAAWVREQDSIDYEQGTHAYYLLLGIAKKYPQSKFVTACREFGDLVGKSYFGGSPRSLAIQKRNLQKSPSEWVNDWQRWLNRYPDHPGADDATYFLARSHQAQNEITIATRLWLNMLTRSIGDGDALYLAWPHIRTLMDVGLSTEQIEILLNEYRSSAIAPLLQYVLSVQYARLQNYRKALQLSQKLELATLPYTIFGRYYSPERAAFFLQRMQVMLKNQRHRWNGLLFLQIQNSPESYYRLANNWTGPDGWMNGYLPVWQDDRTNLLPFTSECESWWVCDLKLRKPEEIRSSYQKSSPTSVAITLYQSLLENPHTPAEVREKTLYKISDTLLQQWDFYPFQETARIHPPLGIPTDSELLNTNGEYRDCGRNFTRRRYYISCELVEDKPELDKPPNLDEVDSADAEARRAREDVGDIMRRDYQRRIDSIITELQAKFPNSPDIDSLMFSSYYLSREPKYLKQILIEYPNGKRADEARFLLDKLARDESTPKS
jgi:hypothetical protein